MDGNGNLHVADSGNFRVQWLDAEGNYLAEWAVPESTGPKFQSPQALALDAEGLLYVSDAANNRVYKLEAVTGRQE